MHAAQRARIASAFVLVLLTACGGDDPPAALPPTGSPLPGGGGGTTDQQVPQATLTSPAAFADALTGTLTVTATATDDIGVTAVEFEVDGISAGPADTTAPYSIEVVTTDHAAGQHVVRARARDAAGKVSAWSGATVRFGGTTPVPRGFTLNNTWVTGLTDATALAEAPDGRLFVAQQGGAVRVVKDGVLLPTPLVTVPTTRAGERGLIGIALHPDFTTNGWVYVHYTSAVGGAHGRISRYVAGGDVSDGVEGVLVDLPPLSSATNHNGGALHFGTDGKLYVGVGDNAQGSRAPLLTDVFGKLLRFNDDGSIPTDNPHYATQAGLARAIWARGLRNPFTFAVQPGTGTIHINDVGENTWEEVNVGAAGANYGWPATEGPTTATDVVAPLFAYKHTDATPAGSGPGGFFTGQSIAGGTFYPSTGGTFPAAYAGQYFFADYVSRFVARLDPANDNAAYAFARLGAMPVDLMAGRDGSVYALYRSAIGRITTP